MIVVMLRAVRACLSVVCSMLRKKEDGAEGSAECGRQE
jgi:hypothetical protein